MKKPVWIVFDVGGVLLNWHASLASLAKRLGTEEDRLSDALFTYADDMFVGKISPTQGWTTILKALGVQADAQSIITGWSDKKFWFEDTLKLVRELHSAGYHLSIMTNSWLGLDERVGSSELPPDLKLFKYIFDSSILGFKKPDPRFYHHVEAVLKASGNEIMLIDDSQANFAPAKSLGWQYFLYPTDNSAANNSSKQLLKLLAKSK